MSIERRTPKLREWKEALELVTKELRLRRERHDTAGGLQPPTTDHACEKCPSATMIKPGFLCGFHGAEKLLSTITEKDLERAEVIHNIAKEAVQIRFWEVFSISIGPQMLAEAKSRLDQHIKKLDTLITVPPGKERRTPEEQ